MSEQAILAWMQRLDAKVDSIRESLMDCQGRHRVSAAVGKAVARPRAKLIKALAYLVTAAAGAVAASLAGK